MMNFETTTAAQAYRKVLAALMLKSNSHTVRGLSMFSEICGASIHIKDAYSLDVDITARKALQAYQYCEALWDMSPTTEVWILEKFNKNIRRFVSDQDEGQQERAAWGYGPTVYKALPIMVEELKSDPYSRRAVFTMSRNRDIKGTPPCLVAMQFVHRNGFLDAFVYMRSNDAWLGLPLDIFQFGLMQNVVAGALGYALGSYHHFVGSLHVYERDIAGIKRVLETTPQEPEQRPCIELGPKAYNDVQTGQLGIDLMNVANGLAAPATSGFYPYLKTMQEALRGKA